VAAAVAAARWRNSRRFMAAILRQSAMIHHKDAKYTKGHKGRGCVVFVPFVSLW
jgi:hypothetical protein